jgi:hypothetical protein
MDRATAEAAIFDTYLCRRKSQLIHPQKCSQILPLHYLRAKMLARYFIISQLIVEG